MTISGRVYDVGDVIQVTCDAGYVMNPEQNVGLTCDEDGTWLRTATCVRSCKYSDEKLVLTPPIVDLSTARNPVVLLMIYASPA